MKKKNKILGIFLLILCIFMCSSNFIYALHSKVLSGYNQVTNVGGSNSKNTAGETNDGVTVSKIIEETNLENYFDITLSVNITKKIEEIIAAPDLAVVLVIDTSKTMEDNKLGTQTRMEVAKNSAKNFIDNFYKYSSDAKSKTAVRKVGVVTFARDAKTVVSMQDCKTTTQQSNIKTEIGKIVAQTGEKTQWTNMEAGLSAAQKLLQSSSVKDVTNKYIIFLTDGLPTTYSTEVGGTTGYYPVTAVYEPRPDKTVIGKFYNAQRRLFATGGTDYSDLGARRAEEKALAIRNSGTTIYSIGVGISTQPTMYKLLTDAYNTVDTDTENNNLNYYKNKSPYKVARYYAILPGVTDPSSKISSSTTVANKYKSRTYYKKWLGDYIASGYNNYYYDSDDKEALEKAYASIFTEITKKLEQSIQATWVAEDPMGTDGNINNIDFLGLYDNKNVLKDSLKKGNVNQTDTASYTNNKITWDLKTSDYDTTEVKNNVTNYIYKIKYRIRIQNELDNFNIEKIYNANGKTTLSYNIRKNEILSKTKYIDFPIPQVVGYLGNFTFTKKSSFDNANLSGAKFKLSHDPNCLCHKERKFATINDFTQVSNQDGTVTFSNIPSGHTYILEETEAPIDHTLQAQKYNVVVSYGTVSGTPKDNVLVNELNKGNLEIQKLVLGNVENPGEFEFILEVKYKDNKIGGTYNYKINDTTNGTINLDTGIIKLKKDDKIVIYDLPVGATYSLKETTTNGFKVEHEVNSNGITLGEIATCSGTTCRIEQGDVNKVKFINTAGYILPATGSSNMLILLIIGSLLLGTPVIYIGYSFYKHIRNNA